MMFQGKSDKRIYIVLIAATIVIGAVFFVFLINRPVNSYTFNIASSNPDVGRVEDDGYYFDSEHSSELTEDEQRVFLNIPQAVNAGSYTLRIGYRSNAGSTISVTSKTNPWAVKCDYVSLNHKPQELPGEFNMNYGLGYLPGFVNANMFITRDVEDLDIFVVYCGYQDFHIESVELIGNRNYVKAIWLAGMFLLVLLEFVGIGFIKGFWKSETGIELAVIIGITVIVSIPLVFKMGLLFDDGDFLYGKINGIADGLMDGQFPVRIHPNTLKGYGYALSYFYPELFLYPFAILKIFGYSSRFVVYALLFCINFATALVSFVCVKRVMLDVNSDNKAQDGSSLPKKNLIPIVSAFLYTFNSYRLMDMYSRGAIAEVIGIIFLPLVVTGLYVIVVENGSVSWLTVGIIGLVNSHVLSCEMVALFAIILCFVCYKNIFKKDSIIKLIQACGISALLSSYFLVPFLHMSTTDQYKVYAGNAYETSANMLGIKDILALSIASNGKINNGTFINSRYTLGAFVVIASVCLFVWVLVKHKNDEMFKFCLICFGLGSFALVLSSSLFPWRTIENVGGIVRTVFCMVQFPWRYLSIAMVCYTFSMACCLDIVFRNENKKNIMITAISATLCALVLVQAICYFSTLKSTAVDNQLIYDGVALDKYNMVGMGEYEPVNFDDSDLDHSIEELQLIFDENAVINPTGDMGNSGLTIGPLSKSGTESTILIINPTGEEKTLYMPITYYKGYEVSNVAESQDGAEILPELYETEYGTVGLKVPVGYYNGAHIEYKVNLLHRLAELISVVTLATLAVVVTKRSRIKNEK